MSRTRTDQYVKLHAEPQPQVYRHLEGPSLFGPLRVLLGVLSLPPDRVRLLLQYEHPRLAGQFGGGSVDAYLATALEQPQLLFERPRVQLLAIPATRGDQPLDQLVSAGSSNSG